MKHLSVDAPVLRDVHQHENYEEDKKSRQDAPHLINLIYQRQMRRRRRQHGEGPRDRGRRGAEGGGGRRAGGGLIRRRKSDSVKKVDISKKYSSTIYHGITNNSSTVRVNTIIRSV